MSITRRVAIAGLGLLGLSKEVIADDKNIHSGIMATLHTAFFAEDESHINAPERGLHYRYRAALSDSEPGLISTYRRACPKENADESLRERFAPHIQWCHDMAQKYPGAHAELLIRPSGRISHSLYFGDALA